MAEKKDTTKKVAKGNFENKKSSTTHKTSGRFNNSGNKSRGPRGGGRGRRRPGSGREQDEFDQVMIDLARVTRVMAGGKRMRFRACMVIGDHKGKIGWAVAKGADVSIAINKAVTKAKKHLMTVKTVDGTIPHVIETKFKAAKVLLKPAKKGSGVKAGGAVRTVLELSGIEDISAKIIGSKNKINNVQAVFQALSNLKYGARAEQQKSQNSAKIKNKEVKKTTLTAKQ